jgi:CIC family chloride channel protein
MTGYLQEKILEETSAISSILLIFLPSIGITTIYFLRKYFFQNRKNKGIKEIYTTLQTRKDHLPFFKIPSHYINGFLTVIFGALPE